jgi:hypothetical protein
MQSQTGARKPTLYEEAKHYTNGWIEMHLQSIVAAVIKQMLPAGRTCGRRSLRKISSYADKSAFRLITAKSYFEPLLRYPESRFRVTHQTKTLSLQHDTLTVRTIDRLELYLRFLGVGGYAGGAVADCGELFVCLRNSRS